MMGSDYQLSFKNYKREIKKEPNTKSKNEDELSNRLSSLSLDEINDDET